MKSFLSILIILTLSSAIASAQETPRGDMRAKSRAIKRVVASQRPAASGDDMIDRVFDRYVEAQGGLILLMSVKSRIMRGAVTHSKANVPGSFESYTKAPNKSLFMLEVPGIGQHIEASDGREVWFRLPFVGTFAIDTLYAEALKRNVSASFSQNYRDLFSSIRYRGESKLDGREVYMIEGTPIGHPRQIMYFDKHDGLIVRIDYAGAAEAGWNIRTVTIDSYAKVDGVTIPIKFKQVYKDHTLIFDVYEVKHNVAIQDAMFNNPKAMTLKKDELMKGN